MTPKHGSIIRPNALWFRDYYEDAADCGITGDDLAVVVPFTGQMGDFVLTAKFLRKPTQLWGFKRNEYDVITSEEESDAQEG